MSPILVLPSGSLVLSQSVRGVDSVSAPKAGPAKSEGKSTGTQDPNGAPTKGTAPNATDSCMSMLPLFIGMFALMYLLVIRPQQKQEKKRRAMLDAIKKGDAIVTSGGIHGEVTALDDKSVTIKCLGGDGVHLKIDRAAVGRVPGAEAEAAAGNAGSKT